MKSLCSIESCAGILDKVCIFFIVVCFAVFDCEKTGFVTKDDIKHFIILLHEGDLKSNAKIGMQRIESRTKAGGLLSFKDICNLHKTFPSLLFPIFRLQLTFMQVTFSERW